MPPALDRLLASPSALCLLRSIVHSPDINVLCAATCSQNSRRFSSDRSEDQKKRRWTTLHRHNAQVVRRNHGGSPSANVAQNEDSNASRQDELEDAIVCKDKASAWAARLAERERLKGLLGIQYVWHNLRRKNYSLPVEETPEAEFLWSTFVKHPKLTKDVIDHATEIFRLNGKVYPRLYEFTIGYWLQRNPREAMSSHHQMCVQLGLRKLPLRDIAQLGQPTFRPIAWEVLLEIYRNSNERDLYDVVVPHLIERGNLVMAYRWHILCTFREDKPSESSAKRLDVRRFEMKKPDTSPVGEENPKKHTGRFNQELMDRLLGRDTAPVRFDDSFCARMFATRAVQPRSVINGLAMAGVNEIGPQAVLAMAVRTFPNHTLAETFDALREAGISLQGCVFSLALEKFTTEKRWHLVRSMIESDQHPDVFGNADTQRQLLKLYLEQGDTTQAQRTLAILTLFYSDPTAESWNLLLQHQTRRYENQNVLEILEDMRSRNILVSFESIVAIKSLLRPRRRGHRPQQSRIYFDDLRFVTRLYMFILESGLGAIPPTSWTEIVRRFGMLGRFRELRRVLFWLLCWYAPRSSTQFSTLPQSPFLQAANAKLRTVSPRGDTYVHFPGTLLQHTTPLHPVRRLFQPSLLQGLIVWGFRAGLLPIANLELSLLSSGQNTRQRRARLERIEVLKRLNWSVGLQTVVQLRDLGVHVNRDNVIKALQTQFINMFGRSPPRDKALKANRLVRRENTMSYASYVDEVNMIWGSQLLPEPKVRGNRPIDRYAWHPQLPRDSRGLESISLNEMAKDDRLEKKRIKALDRLGFKKTVSKEGALATIENHFSAQTQTEQPSFNTTMPLGSNRRV